MENLLFLGVPILKHIRVVSYEKSFNFFHVRLPWQPKLLYNFHKNFIYVIRTLSLIFLWKISFLAQRVHVSEILRHFFQLYPTHSRSFYNPTGTILTILYRKVPHVLHAKYQPNWHSGSGEEVLHMKFGYIWPSGFRGEVVWKCGWTTDRQRTDDGGFPSYKLPGSLRLRGAKNYHQILPLI